MNLTLLVHSGIWKPLESLVRWCLTRPSSADSTASASPGQQCNAPKSVAPHVLLTRATSPIFVGQKPLRVVRVVEVGQTRASVGRMVISGRMADVCAELDRLAAREAALS